MRCDLVWGRMVQPQRVALVADAAAPNERENDMATVVIEREGLLEAWDIEGAYCTTEVRLLPGWAPDMGLRHFEAGDTTLSLRLSWPVGKDGAVLRGMALGRCKLRLEIERP